MRVYVGVHALAKLAVWLTLAWATTPAGSHNFAAVWIGASTPTAHRWVQAGIFSTDGQTYLYVESMGRTHRVDMIQWSLRVPVLARLQHRGSRWRALVGPLRTPWLFLRQGKPLGALELTRGAHAGCRIGARHVSG